MPQKSATAEDRTFITVTVDRELNAKLERVVARTSASKNALMVALLHTLSEDEIATRFEEASNAGLVNARFRPNSDQRKLLAALSAMTPDQQQRLLAEVTKE